MWKILFARSAKLLIVGSRLCETEVAIRAAQYLVSIVVILTIILPEANSAYIKCSPLGKRSIATTWAAKWKVSNQHRWGITPKLSRRVKRGRLE